MTASSLRALPVPDTEPPLDLVTVDRQGWLTTARRAPRPAVQGVLSLVVNDPVRYDSVGYDSVRYDAVGYDAVGYDEEPARGPQPTSTRDLPPAADWGGRLLRLVVEVMCGQRPRAQLLRWTTPAVHDQVLAQMLPRSRRGSTPKSQQPRISSVRVCEPVDGVAEVSAVVHGGHRTRAIALRMEGRDGRWQATVLETG